MKTKLKTLGFIAIIALLITSCKKDEVMNPVGCFTTDKTTIAAGESVSFDAACSTDTHHWEWDFGDGATGEGVTISHTYNNAGTYTVKLEAHNEDMTVMDEETKTITVN